MSGTVVFIDDEPTLCRLTRLLFRAMAASVPLETFTDARKALLFIQSHETAVVICDYRMPYMNGLEVLACIERDVPFYLLSGAADVTREASVNPRVVGVLSKPFPPDQLLDVVQCHLGQR